MKKTVKILSFALCILMVVTVMASWSGPGSDDADTSSESIILPSSEDTKPSSEKALASDKCVIGFSLYSTRYEFFQNMEKGVKQEVKALGYGYQLHDEKEDETEMVSGALYLIDEGVRALIISPFKPEALDPIVTAAHEKGIPVVIADIGTGGTDYDAFVIADCYGGGQMAADYTVQKLKANKVAGKKVAIIKCETSAVYAIRRGEGYKAAIEAAGYTVVKEITANSNKDEGYAAMQDILAANSDIVAVFAENDSMAVGAAEVLKQKKKTDIVLVGFNGDESALEAIKDGTMDATIAQDAEAIGKLSATVADRLIHDEKIIFDNEELREVYAEVQLVTDGSIIIDDPSQPEPSSKVPDTGNSDTFTYVIIPLLLSGALIVLSAKKAIQ